MLLPAWAMRIGDYDYNLSEKKSDHENFLSAADKGGLATKDGNRSDSVHQQLVTTIYSIDPIEMVVTTNLVINYTYCVA